MTRPRIAIAHDYLTQRGGAERVVLSLSRAFPDAQIHTLLYDPAGTYPEFASLPIRTSPLNRIAALRKDHRRALPVLRPFADRMSIDADLTIVSSSGWAHGFPTTGRKLIYCHSPARWLYLSDEYLGRPTLSSPSGLALQLLQPSLVRWDQQSARKADRYLSNSSLISRRIQRVYGFSADPLFPPGGVDATGEQHPIAQPADWLGSGLRFHLLVSRLLPYKNVDQAIRAFDLLPDERLLVIGRGPERDALHALASDRVAFAEGVSDSQMRWAYAHATALIAPSCEDFGLTPVEANAYGTPVLALRAGGYLDTVADSVSGLFFDSSTPRQIAAAVRRSADVVWNAQQIIQHAESFSEERFIHQIRSQAEELLP
jgi:glycosyltransferase involved in cell wall biosynthesis